jgi:transcription antitermination factor NusG
MKKSWYAVYTKPQCEKKAASLLTKKRIENFFPLNSCLQKNGGNRKKVIYEPLFPSFVFVFISESEMSAVRQTNDVINFVYWLGKPAVIKSAEIENINHFVNSYYNIHVEKTAVNPNGMVHITNEQDSDNKKIISFKTNTIHASLPSLGYIMHAETEVVLESLKYDLGNSNMLI